MTSVSVRGALGALALVLFAAPALAQTAPPDDAARHQRMHDMMEQHRAMMGRDLHTILNLRPDQDAAFSAFQASMARPPHEEGMKHDWKAMEAMTTPQKLDMMLKHMDDRAARMRQHIQATRAFYAVLSPEQQRVFDALGRLHHGGMHGHGGWGGHGDGGGHMHGMGDGPPPSSGD